MSGILENWREMAKVVFLMSAVAGRDAAFRSSLIPAYATACVSVDSFAPLKTISGATWKGISTSDWFLHPSLASRDAFSAAALAALSLSSSVIPKVVFPVLCLSSAARTWRGSQSVHLQINTRLKLPRPYLEAQASFDYLMDINLFGQLRLFGRGRAFWSDMEHIHLGSSSPASQDSTSPAKYGEGGRFVVQGNLDKYDEYPNLEGRPNPGVLGHRCWLVCKSEEHPTKGGLSNAIDGSGSFDVVKDGGHRLMVLMVLASSTTASTDVEQLKMGPNDEHLTSAMDVELVLASLTRVDTIGGTSGLDIVDNSEHSICHYVQGTEGLGIVNNSEQRYWAIKVQPQR
ncbi:hypothetical protein B0H14DRAFT_2572393 [Mycena olivaceomarginata]|nr:hypothetical protein B0H14DRAFT_2572393 [Mycena olivaceomarginata]